ncbi:MAG: nitroreductase/quinone reductase family protein [Mycobacteriaceae bacterium]
MNAQIHAGVPLAQSHSALSGSHHGAMPEEPHYQQPDWFSRNVMNPVVATATRLGVSLFGSRILRVRGRSSGLWRETPVNLLSLDGDRYLVAPRGETQWVRNLRAAGGGELRVGRRIEPFRAEELAPADKNPVLRAYLKRWRWEVGAFFGGVRADSPEEAVTAEASTHPIFRIAAA